MWKLLGGSLLLLLAMAMLASNESSVMTYRTAAARHGGVVVDATRSGPTAANDSDMVRVAGTPRVVKPAVDKQFGIRADVPILWRVTEMFQWREIDYGGSASYELQWVDHPVNSNIFRERARHENPSALPFGGARYLAGEVRLGGFTLSPAIVAAMPGRTDYAPDFGTLRPNMAASFRVVNDTLMTSEDPNSPQLGDLRVSWRSAPLQEVTVIARNRDGVLVPAEGVEDNPGFELQVGQREVMDLQPDMPPQPWLPWLWRVLSLVVATVGAYVLLHGMSPSRRGAPLAALGVGVALTSGLGGVMWVTERTDLGGVLLGIAVLALGVTAWQMYERSSPA
ncbi:TMEM43 family protein [Oleiagrimonas sp. MCCC 1A03011]|uniref:TMEM43 family protein n=1 Tax=Oleiagrimonas sp. MCCC 1A03011 TaxID=1926883 RepID=UPI00143E06CB|nr:TMEM43 family protein [Oleiagrimonas sp. MCCC 1A03011]